MITLHQSPSYCHCRYHILVKFLPCQSIMISHSIYSFSILAFHKVVPSTSQTFKRCIFHNSILSLKGDVKHTPLLQTNIFSMGFKLGRYGGSHRALCVHDFGKADLKCVLFYGLATFIS